MVNNSNKMSNHLLPQMIEHKKEHKSTGSDLEQAHNVVELNWFLRSQPSCSPTAAAIKTNDKKLAQFCFCSKRQHIITKMYNNIIMDSK